MSNMLMVVVGAGAVGKSSISIRFIQGKFEKKYDPTLEDFYRKQIEVDGQAVVLDILDTAGQEEYTSLRSQYMHTGNGFILVYSITSAASFEECRTLHDQIVQVKGEGVPIVLVGNKCDLEGERGVSTEEGQSLAKEFGPNVTFMESSAKENQNIEEIFVTLARKIREYEATRPAPKKRRLCGK